MSFATTRKFAEFYRISFQESEDGLWLALLDEPLSVSMPPEDQAEHLLKYAYLTECNKAFAKMYGYSDPKDLVGVRFPQLLIQSDPANLKAVRAFLTSNYQIKNAETHEAAKNGQEKYFLNEVYGVVEDDFLVRVWGKQKDITSRKVRQLSFDHLTSQQLTVLKLTVQGKTLKEIGQFASVSEKTVDTMRSRLKKKFNAKTIPELAARAAQLGLLDQLGLFDEE